MIKTWIIGQGGLFGGALQQNLLANDRRLYQPAIAFDWTQIDTLKAQFLQQMTQFFSTLQTHDRWQIIWAAGKATMRSPENKLIQETQVLACFLDSLEKALHSQKLPGVFGFTSSAGALYSQSDTMQLSELSIPNPNTAYGKHKLAQEQILTTWSLKNPYCEKILLGRISNLYGPQQDHNKQQGLISHIIRCYRQKTSLPLFVPLETQRDYIWVHDAAEIFLWHLENSSIDKTEAVRIIAQEQSLSIQDILQSLFALTGHALEVSHCQQALSKAYPLEVHFQSLYPITRPAFQRIAIEEGLKKMLSIPE